ncbi:hypothetical protein ACROYT_G004983 [Oculina patagonica]
MRTRNGVSIISSLVWTAPDTVFSTDACLSGCGGLSQSQYFHVQFPSVVLARFLEIHLLEALAILVALRLWGHLWAGCRIQVSCDNAAVVPALTSGSVASRSFAASHDFELRAVHLSGEENRAADLLSRWHLDSSFEARFRQLPVFLSTSQGSIMVFDIPPRGTAVKLQETLDSHKVAICELEAQGGRMVSTDEEGNITVWQSGGHFTEIIKIDGKGLPCSSVCFYKDYIIGGFATGHIRVFSISTGALCIEACAHARWISGLDICVEAGLLVSASEDSFVRVWKISADDSPTMEMVFQQAITDAQLCGARFVDLSGNSFGVTGYDLGEIIMFSKQ